MAQLGLWKKAQQFFSSRYSLLVILIIAGLHGLLYVFLIPPWQHYDEPSHFEYTWLIAHTGELPEAGVVNPELRYLLVDSMIRNGFFDTLGWVPDLNTPKGLEYIGPASQLGDDPLYYIITAAAMGLVKTASAETQLYAMRLVSWLFLLISVAAAWGVSRELLPTAPVLQWMAPLTMALLPGFVDLMTAANNDTAAVAGVSVTVYLSARTLRRGVRFFPMVGLLAAGVFSVLAKTSGMVAVVVVFLTLLLVLFPRRWRGMASVGVVLLGGLMLGILADWNYPAAWNIEGNHSATRQASPFAVDGRHVFRLEPGTKLRQLIGVPDYPLLESKTLTLGAWMWAEKPVQSIAPYLVVRGAIPQDRATVQLELQPQFFATQVIVQDTLPPQVWVELRAPSEIPGAPAIYVDGFVLVEGSFADGSVPEAAAAGMQELLWGGVRVPNLLRNPSAERSTPWIPAPVSSFVSSHMMYAENPSIALYAVTRLDATRSYFQLTAAHMLRTFWAKFGWGAVPLLGKYPYRPLLAATLLGLIGFAIGLIQQALRPKKAPSSDAVRLQLEYLVLFIIVILVVVGLAFSRGAVYYFYPRPYVPPARYIYPAMIPMLVFLCMGWFTVLRIVRLNNLWGILIHAIGFLILDVYAVASLVAYYGM